METNNYIEQEEFDLLMKALITDVPKEHLEAVLAERYRSVVFEGFINSFNLNVSLGETKIVSSLTGDMFVSQIVDDGNDAKFLSGLAIKADDLRPLAIELDKMMKGKAEGYEYEDSEEDAIDFFKETLNVINGLCTYQFEQDFDLSAPNDHENSIIKAPQIYVTEMNVLSFKINLVFVFNAAVEFKNTTACKILIIDDSRTARRILRTMVEEMGHEVIGEAENGIDGRDQYFELNPDVVLTDLTMPVLDGASLIRQLRDKNKNAKVVVVSSNANQNKLIEVIDAGAVGFTFKPVKKTELEMLINKAIRTK